jgi:hypothetical protein
VALVATIAEKEEKAVNKDDRGVNARVFTVRGNRENTRGNRYGNHGENSNGAELEVPGRSIRLGRHNTRGE